MKRLRIEPEAVADLDAARAWYDAAGEGVTARFVDAVEHAIHLARERPASFPFVHSMTRRVRLSRFPYVVLFQDKADATVVLGVIHSSRDPDAFIRRSR